VALRRTFSADKLAISLAHPPIEDTYQFCRSRLLREYHGGRVRGPSRRLVPFRGSLSSGVGRRKALGLVRRGRHYRRLSNTFGKLRRGWMAGWRTGWGIAPSAHPGSSPNLLVGARESHWECVVLLAIGIKK
jgi:hypothetical protein